MGAKDNFRCHYLQKLFYSLSLALAFLYVFIPAYTVAQSLPITDGLTIHLVADDITGANNSSVATWSDSAGSGLVAEQSTLTRQPLLIKNALATRAVVRFDGIDDRLNISSNIFSSAAFPKTVFAVLQTMDVNGHIIGTGSSSSGFLPSFGSAITLLGGKMFAKANSSSSGLGLMAIETVSSGVAQIITAQMSPNDSRLETNCSFAQSASTLNAFAYSSTTIGASGTAIDPLRGDIAEIIVYDRVLGANEIASVRAYLESRYNITLVARIDNDDDGIFDGCDSGTMYLNDQNISVSLISPDTLTGGVIGNVIDATSPTAFDVHNQTTHVWRSNADLELLLDLGMEYDLEKLHFWNYTGEGFDVDDVTFTFLNSSNTEVGVFNFSPELGQAPIFAQDVFLNDIKNTRYVNVLLTGTNDEVDFQNIGFTGLPSGDPDLIFRDQFESGL